MGAGLYSSDVTRDYVATSSRTGRTMAHAAAVTRGEVEAKVHKNLDPKRKNRAGVVIRESLDSEAHPNAVPVAVLFDTTGSMCDIPERVIKLLPDLMDLIIKKNYLTDPQVLFGAINDATTNPVAALEIGQFESGNQMDDVLSNILVSQGGGGGSTQESYELAMYFMARKTKLDCVDKRSKKGYLFILGDETPYDFVSKDEVKEWIGDTIQDDIPVEEIVNELKQKFEVFWLFPTGASNSNDSKVQNKLKKLFGQHFIHLKKLDDICTTIAAAIAVNEGRDPKVVKQELAEGLASVATDKEIAAIVDAIPPRRLDDI